MAGSQAGLDRPSDPLLRRDDAGNPRLPLGRMVEAWAYVIVLAAVASACAWKEVWWPLYPAVGIIGLVAWLRKI
ncbi:hypothetical protein [Pseudodesulfovibrio sp.]|uniref:hypothetical protein n=1 Tax=Pseudodesulfovibrio sp. TaxID=2035812 RepID=UPI0026065D60|nr:hypothetical protein [Pseudodesulfovibrio sp.]MDD3311899.1 hypothetical protein [Pseudodesulfovibrio sp.]